MTRIVKPKKRQQPMKSSDQHILRLPKDYVVGNVEEDIKNIVKALNSARIGCIEKGGHKVEMIREKIHVKCLSSKSDFASIRNVAMFCLVSMTNRPFEIVARWIQNDLKFPWDEFNTFCKE